ncbi:hypothetical protein L1987_58185 [Smallanthus sonchifolius]|uniref:Uncharacterized protein n=1 Tax=Smallanthus sonchifolius TaxID=185202 RepID=A0ACB9DFE0_9ASTR|nr:hypothetical protein L1987_58185 [Smallanthus sonchifolius]
MGSWIVLPPGPNEALPLDLKRLWLNRHDKLFNEEPDCLESGGTDVWRPRLDDRRGESKTAPTLLSVLLEGLASGTTLMSDDRPPVGVWHSAGARNGREQQRNHFRWKSRSWGQGVTSFYVSNLPEGTKAIDLKTCFGEYGKVVDSYVAAKKDKTRCLFGFARFEGVKNKVGMEVQLSSVNLNNARLSVNLAKYNKEGKLNNEDEARLKSFPPISQHGQPGGGGAGGAGSEYLGGKSYRSAMLRGHVQHSMAMDLELPKEDGEGLSQWYGISVVDGGDWVPMWIGRSDGKLPSDRRTVHSPAVSTHSNSAGEEVVEELHGEHNCMGMGMNIDDIGGPEKSPWMFKFVARKNVDSLAQNDQVSPSIDIFAQSLNAAIGLKPRKRPRTGCREEDPFNLDQFIGAANTSSNTCLRLSVAESVGGGDVGVIIPDLNASMGESLRVRHFEGNPNSTDREGEVSSKEWDQAGYVEQEVEETIKLGTELGIELHHERDQVRATIIGEMEEAVNQ